MAIRNIDPNLVTKAWYIDMSPVSKLIFYHLIQICNTAGLWDLDVRALGRAIGVDKISLQDFLADFNRDYDNVTGEEIKRMRAKVVCGGRKLWLTGFLQFQWAKKGNVLSRGRPVCIGAVKILIDEGLFVEALGSGFVQLDESWINVIDTHISRSNLMIADDWQSLLMIGNDPKEQGTRNKEQELLEDPEIKDLSGDVVNAGGGPREMDDLLVWAGDLAERWRVRVIDGRERYRRFSDVKVDLQKWTVSIMQLVQLDKLTREDVEGLIGYLCVRRMEGVNFSWYDQVGTPGKLRDWSKSDKTRRIYGFILPLAIVVKKRAVGMRDDWGCELTSDFGGCGGEGCDGVFREHFRSQDGGVVKRIMCDGCGAVYVDPDPAGVVPRDADVAAEEKHVSEFLCGFGG